MSFSIFNVHFYFQHISIVISLLFVSVHYIHFLLLKFPCLKRHLLRIIVDRGSRELKLPRLLLNFSTSRACSSKFVLYYAFTVHTVFFIQLYISADSLEMLKLYRYKESRTFCIWVWGLGIRNFSILSKESDSLGRDHILYRSSKKE